MRSRTVSNSERLRLIDLTISLLRQSSDPNAKSRIEEYEKQKGVVLRRMKEENDTPDTIKGGQRVYLKPMRARGKNGTG